MADLIIVRHAQASFGADDYDVLSELGWQQSRWLGEHFKALGMGFDRLIVGSQRRHRETAEGVADTLGLSHELEVRPGLNEYDFKSVVAGYFADRPIPDDFKSDRRTHFRILRDALLAWSRDEISGELPERWLDFEKRVSDVLLELNKEKDQRILAISSGGPISMSLKHVLELTPDVMIRLNLQMKNTGYSRYVSGGNAIYLNLFNATPHLDPPDRSHAVTYS